MTRHLLGPFLRRQRFDLFHGLFGLLPRGLDRPAVVTIHDLMWLVNPRFITRSALRRLVAGTFFRTGLESALAEAARVLTVSQATARAIAEHSPWYAAKLRVAPNGIDPAAFPPLSEEEARRLSGDLVPPGTPFVLTVGNASPHKNHLGAVRGFLRAFGDRLEYRLLLVRRFLRQDRVLSRLLQEPRVRRQVTVLPHLPAEVLRALYQRARIFLHPSYYEGFGIPVLEAMAAGIPVVTSRTSCLPEVAGDAALLVDPASEQELAAALQELDRDEDLRRRLVALGQKRLERFTWQECARRTLAAYSELVY